MDLPTLAALLGHSKLNMLTRYVHPAEKHQADEMKRMAAILAAKEIAEIEKQKDREKTSNPKTLPTVSTTVAENQANSTRENSTIN